MTRNLPSTLCTNFFFFSSIARNGKAIVSNSLGIPWHRDAARQQSTRVTVESKTRLRAAPRARHLGVESSPRTPVERHVWQAQESRRRRMSLVGKHRCTIDDSSRFVTALRYTRFGVRCRAAGTSSFFRRLEFVSSAVGSPRDALAEHLDLVDEERLEHLGALVEGRVSRVVVAAVVEDLRHVADELA